MNCIFCSTELNPDNTSPESNHWCKKCLLDVMAKPIHYDLNCSHWNNFENWCKSEKVYQGVGTIDELL